MSAALLSSRGVSKSFGGVQALSEVSLDIQRGEIYGLIGPNGAGKTTFFNVLTSLYPVDAGGFEFDGARLDARGPHEVAERGIARTFQNIRLFSNTSALENVMVGRHVRTRAGVLGAVLRGPATRTEERAIHDSALALLEFVGLADRRDQLSRHLPYGDQRKLEIARALATRPSFMLLDEPFAGIDPIAVNDIRALVRHLTQRGIGVLITDHNVRETLDLVSRAYIIHDGMVLTHGTAQEVINNEDVRRVYLGDQFRI